MSVYDAHIVIRCPLWPSNNKKIHL